MIEAQEAQVEVKETAPEVTTVGDDVRAAVSKAKEREAVESKPRDTTGKFEKVEKQKEEPAEVKAEQTEVKSEVKTEDKVEKVEEKKTTKIPRGLKAHMQTRWGELPPEWQSEIERIDRAGAEGFKKVEDKVKYADSIESVIKPYEYMISAEGGSHQGAIRELFQTAALLRTGTQQQKQAVLFNIAKKFNVPLTQESANPDPLSQHPLVQQLAQKVNELQTSLSQRSQQEQNAQLSQAESVLNSFLNEVDSDGVVKHPMDESLEEEFATEIASLRQRNPDWDNRKVLETAYERTSWKIPEIRNELLRRQDAQKEAERRKAEQESIDRKKAAGGSIRGSSVTTSKASGGSVRDIVSNLVRSGGHI